MNKTKHRIISLLPSVTETLYELGLEEQIVGITDWCTSPFHFKSTKTIVLDGENGLKKELIKELKPSIIILDTLEFSDDMIDELSDELGDIYLWNVSINSYESSLEFIKELGEAFNKKTDARKWVEKIEFAKKDFDAFIETQPVRKIAYLLGKNPYISVNKETYEQVSFEMNKFKNIYENRTEMYPTIELKKIRIQGDPDLVLLPSNLYKFSEEDIFEIGRYTHHGKTIFVEEEMFSWFGVRLYYAFDYFKKIHERI